MRAIIHIIMCNKEPDHLCQYPPDHPKFECPSFHDEPEPPYAQTFIIDTFIPGTGAYPAHNYTGSFTIRVTDRLRANVIVNLLNQLTTRGYPLDTLFKVRDNMQGS